jgi:enoyl-CoA hydratase
MPDWGGGVALARLLGPGRAADLILTGRKVDAAEVLSLGFANRISAPHEALNEALAMAESIAANGPLAVRRALATIRSSGDQTFSKAVAAELASAAELIATGECQVGIMALMAKKKPVFPDPK